MLLLCGGCAQAPSDAGALADRVTIVQVPGYTAAQQQRAAAEMEDHCGIVPILCWMINDYGRMRDEARAAAGLPVDITR
jgi:hypothetical protein